MPERRPLLDVVIVVLLVLIGATGLPQFVPGVPRLERLVDPLADLTGLQQSNWRLFAPDPDHVNAWVEAIVVFDDGQLVSVPTQDWRDRTLLQELVQGRLPKIADNLRRDDWKALWAPYAQWVARTTPPPTPGSHAVEVKLVRHWWTVPRPERLARARERFGEIPPPRDAFPGRAEYFTWTVPR